MNYRHIYHAGNFADIMKHLILMQVVKAMQKKDAALLLCDAHAGVGVYDLQSAQAQKTQEYLTGIAALVDAPSPPPAWQDFLQVVRREGYPRFYPGSPFLLSGLARPQDRIVLNELHPDDVETLAENMGRQKRVSITAVDAYACVRAHTPPIERRGLYLIDPPFEQKDEFARLQQAIPTWHSRFSTGVYMIWYPIKRDFPLEDLYQTVRDSGFHRAWCAETMRYPIGTPDVLNGCGVIVLNTPYPVAETAAEFLPPLQNVLELQDVTMRWLGTSL
ncbi:MAG: 23S rRNA (adenine(2030)-N(6))-methyltransferase RlmJ [Pseudomonadota bacterium]